MFKNVLVGVDGREGGRDAIALASRLAGEDAQITLAHVHSGELNPLHAITPGLLAQEEQAADALLEREREQGGVRAELLSLVAVSPGRGLHQQAEQQGADVIVVGSTRRGVLGRATLGDDARAALNGAPCAIAIAAGGYAEHPTPIARVGVGYDGSPEATAALAKAREVAAATRASLSALEVVSIPSYAFTGLVATGIGETIDLMLQEANERMKALPDVDGRAIYGLVGEELAAFGDELDLLVVGSRNYGPIRRLVVGSTSDYLERHGRCSLLVLPRLAGARAGEAATDRKQAEAPLGTA
jgi:nucleotide-binding universal stress UspA family protein